MTMKRFVTRYSYLVLKDTFRLIQKKPGIKAVHSYSTDQQNTYDCNRVIIVRKPKYSYIFMFF